MVVAACVFLCLSLHIPPRHHHLPSKRLWPYVLVTAMCRDRAVCRSQVRTSSSGKWPVYYAGPSIASVAPLLLNTTGGPITITGINFGLDQWVMSPTPDPVTEFCWVTLVQLNEAGDPYPGRAPLECVPVPGGWLPRSVTCVVPPLVVPGLLLTVNVSGQTASFPSSGQVARLRFSGPSIALISHNEGAGVRRRRHPCEPVVCVCVWFGSPRAVVLAFALGCFPARSVPILSCGCSAACCFPHPLVSAVRFVSASRALPADCCARPLPDFHFRAELRADRKCDHGRKAVHHRELHANGH